MRIFQQYVDRRPPEMCQEDSPFYLSINHKHKPGSYWYKKLPLGIHKVDGMMKNLAKDGSLTGKKTNHSARKTQVQTLCAANVADSAVMQLSGHKSVQSLNHYKRPSLQQEKHMSHLLSNYCPSSSVKQSPPPIVTAAQSSVNYAMLPHPTVSKAHLPLVNQAVQSHPPVCQAAHSPLISEGVQSRPPIVCQEVRSPLVNQAVQSRPPIVCQDEARSPLISEAVQSRPPIVCQDEARSPLISEGVQSRPPVLSQLQLPAQATITPSSVHMYT